MAGNTASFWKDIELRIYPYPFCTSCQISLMNKNSRSKNTLRPKPPSKCVFMDIVTATAPIYLTSETTFSNRILIVDACSKIPKLYGMERIIT